MTAGAARLAAAVTAALLTLSMAVTIADPSATDGGVPLSAFAVVAFAGLAMVGAVVAPRQPVIGGIFCATPLFFSLAAACETLSRAVDGGNPWLLWVDNWAWVPAIVPMLGLVPLLFPTGAPPGPRWRWAGRATVTGGALILLGFMLTPGPMQDLGADNPLVTAPGLRDPLGALTGAGFLITAAGVLGAAAALVHRFRRSRGIERLQLKWVTTAFALCGLMWAAMVVAGLLVPDVDDRNVGWVLLVLGQLAFAVSVAIATLRYRLYEIDVVIRRTVVYTLLTAALAGTYLATVLLLQLVLPARSDLAVAGSTLAVAALFRPVRARVQTIVDRRFFRRRFDAQQSLQAFGARLRREVTLESISRELIAVAGETMQPAHVSVWLRRRP